MERSESVAQLMAAFSKAQGEFPEIPKSKTATVKLKSGGSYDFSYADIADVIKTIRPNLKEHKLVVTQDHRNTDKGLEVRTILWHESGEYLASEWLSIPVDARHAQAVGSANTYARRYSMSTLLGVATEVDDGGDLASQNSRNTSSATRQTPQSPNNGNGTNNGDDVPSVRQQCIDAIKEWADVDGEDLAPAMYTVINCAGVKYEEGTPLDEPQWMKVWTWIREHKGNGETFAEATSEQQTQEAGA